MACKKRGVREKGNKCGNEGKLRVGKTVGDNLCRREKQTERGKSEQVKEKQATKGL